MNPESVIPNLKLKLLDQVSEVMRFKHYSLRTEQAYRQWIERFLRFHRRAPHPGSLPIRQAAAGGGEGVVLGGAPKTAGGTPALPGTWPHPQAMGVGEVRGFLTHLASERNVSASTQNQALNALLFMYRHVLERGLEFVEGFGRARREPRVPVVLTKAEMERWLAAMPDTYRLFCQLLYGTGMRLMEGLRLRVHPVR